MAWPQSDEVEAAIQYPGLSFRDPELRGGMVALDDHGLPKVASGNSAYVYELRNGGQRWAVRVFSRAVTDQARRYALIAPYLATLGSPYFVECVYMADELLVQGARYPIVKMQWVEGVTLTTWVKRHCWQPDQLRKLAQKWEALLRELGRHPMAHGDLQHDNVLVTPGGQLKLIDYDGMYMPEMQGERGPELGHPNWNHPGRTAATFGPYLDEFPGLVGYLSLLAVAADPALLDRYCTDDNLIFTRRDFMDPQHSRVFQELRRSTDPEVRQLAETLIDWCTRRGPDGRMLVKGVHQVKPTVPVISPSPSASHPAPSPPATGSTLRRTAPRRRPPTARWFALAAAGAAVVLSFVILLSGKEFRSKSGQTALESQRITVPEDFRRAVRDGLAALARNDDARATAWRTQAPTVRTVTGVLVSVADLAERQSPGGFTLKADRGKEITFFGSELHPNDISEPSEDEIGKRFLVEFHEVSYRAASGNTVTDRKVVRLTRESLTTDERVREALITAKQDLDRGDYAGAESKLQKAKVLDPLNNEILVLLARTQRAREAEDRVRK